MASNQWTLVLSVIFASVSWCIGYHSLYFLTMFAITYKGTTDKLVCGLLKPLVLYTCNIYIIMSWLIFSKFSFFFPLQSNPMWWSKLYPRILLRKKKIHLIKPLNLFTHLPETYYNLVISAFWMKAFISHLYSSSISYRSSGTTDHQGLELDM